ncbi:MAG: hypothetical protein KGZ25_10035 [Planctomycetes bacterium]|nr:hypothetical protein [Planctomycetota bacterium]
MSSQEEEKQQRSRTSWIKEYVFGMVLGPLLATYGVIAFLVGQSFLPGLHGNGHTVGGSSGKALAAGYFLGGIYLFLRLYLQKRVRDERTDYAVYALENVILVGFIIALIYVLMHVGTVQ